MTAFGYIVVIKRSGEDHTSFPLTGSSCTIGRSQESDIRIQLSTVSKLHCKVVCHSDGKAFAINLSNINPILVNNIAVPYNEVVLLQHKDELSVADRKFRWEYPSGSALIKNKRNSKSPSTSYATNASAKKQRLLEEDRKSVSFGPYLSPEHFDMKLPPSTPVKKGEKPSYIEIQRSNKKLMQIASVTKTESPKKSLLRRRSPTPVKAKLAKSLGLFINSSPMQASPKTPRAASPKTPRAASPKTPRAASPKTPRAASPKTPRAASPKTPKAASPKTPKAASPKTPKAASPKTPKAASPKTPKAASPKTLKAASPKTLKAASPKTLKAASPKTLKAASPKTPKAASPKTPKAASPKTPKAASPKTPKAASPKTPKAASPKTPKAASPKTPKAASPKTPKAASPKTPKAASPKTPKAASPKTPKAASPKTPKAASPKTPKAASPKTPKAASPKTPKAASPKTPKAASPKTPKAASPKTPKAASPKTPKAASPMTPKAANLKRKRVQSPHTVSLPAKKRKKVKSGTPKKEKVVEPIKSFADILKGGIMKTGVQKVERHKVTPKRKILKKTKSPNVEMAIPNSFRFGINSTGHANSPAPIIIHKKLAKTPKIYKKGGKIPASVLTEVMKMSSPELEGLGNLYKVNQKSSSKKLLNRSSSARKDSLNEKNVSFKETKSPQKSESKSIKRASKGEVSSAKAQIILSKLVSPSPTTRRTRLNSPVRSSSKVTRKSSPRAKLSFYKSPMSKSFESLNSSTETPTNSENSITKKLNSSLKKSSLATPDISLVESPTKLSTPEPRVKTPKSCKKRGRPSKCTKTPRSLPSKRSLPRMVNKTPQSLPTKRKKSSKTIAAPTDSPKFVSKSPNSSMNSIKSEKSAVRKKGRPSKKSTELSSTIQGKLDLSLSLKKKSFKTRRASHEPKNNKDFCTPIPKHLDLSFNVPRGRVSTPKQMNGSTQAAQTPKFLSPSRLGSISKLNMKSPFSPRSSKSDRLSFSSASPVPLTPQSGRKSRTSMRMSPSCSPVTPPNIMLLKSGSKQKRLSKVMDDSMGSNKTNFDFSSLKTPNITADEFISPLGTPGTVNLNLSEKMLRMNRASATSKRNMSFTMDSDLTSYDFATQGTPNISKDQLVSPMNSQLRYSINNKVKSPLKDCNITNSIKKLFQSKDNDISQVYKIFKSSPQADYSNVHGLKRLFKSPRLPRNSPLADYTNVSGVKKLMTEKVISVNKTPVANYTDVQGMKNLLRSIPRKSPKADYTNVNGVKNLLRHVRPMNRGISTNNLEGIKAMLTTPNGGSSPSLSSPRRSPEKSISRSRRKRIFELPEEVVGTQKKEENDCSSISEKKDILELSSKPEKRVRRARPEVIENEEEVPQIRTRGRAKKVLPSVAKVESELSDLPKRKRKSSPVENSPPKKKVTRSRARKTSETSETIEKSKTPKKSTRRTKKSDLLSPLPAEITSRAETPKKRTRGRLAKKVKSPTPVKKVKTPVKKIKKTPVKKVKTPVKKVKTPVKKVKKVKTPVKKVKKVETPVKKVETPVKKVKTPVKKVKTTVKKVETPIKKVETPVKKVETPVKKVKTPVKKVKTPVKKAKKTPVKKVKTPVKKTPVKKVKTPVKKAKKTPTKKVKSPVISTRVTRSTRQRTNL